MQTLFLFFCVLYFMLSLFVEMAFNDLQMELQSFHSQIFSNTFASQLEKIYSVFSPQTTSTWHYKCSVRSGVAQNTENELILAYWMFILLLAIHFIWRRTFYFTSRKKKCIFGDGIAAFFGFGQQTHQPLKARSKISTALAIKIWFLFSGSTFDRVQTKQIGFLADRSISLNWIPHYRRE